jgi:hypothetical protein
MTAAAIHALYLEMSVVFTCKNLHSRGCIMTLEFLIFGRTHQVGWIVGVTIRRQAPYFQGVFGTLPCSPTPLEGVHTPPSCPPKENAAGLSTDGVPVIPEGID